jgi:IS1 family transposase
LLKKPFNSTLATQVKTRYTPTHCEYVNERFRISRYRTSSRHQPQYGSAALKNILPKQITGNIDAKAEVVICCEADEQWSYVQSKANLRWLFYAYERIRKRALAHVFGPRNTSTLLRLLTLLSKFDIAFYMTNAWPVYKALLSVTSHVVSKKYTQRIERHNLNLWTHIKRLTCRTICFSKSEEMHDKIIGWYLTIHHYQ